MITQNAARKCREFTKESILVSYHAVSYVLTVDYLKKITFIFSYVFVEILPIER